MKINSVLSLRHLDKIKNSIKLKAGDTVVFESENPDVAGMYDVVKDSEDDTINGCLFCAFAEPEFQHYCVAMACSKPIPVHLHKRKPKSE